LIRYQEQYVLRFVDIKTIFRLAEDA